jgi:tRNA G18 (ribose-2'-O)-methylase SpoU
MLTPVSIDSVGDQRLDPFRQLKGQNRRHDGMFVAESELVFDRLVESSIVIASVLMTPPRVERVLAALEGNVGASGTGPGPTVDPTVYVASQALIDEVVGYPLHRGVVALAVRPSPRTVDSVIADARTVVVLEHVMDPDNVGSLFRHCAGFGADAVVFGGHAADPLYRKTVRTSMGWSLTIPFAHSEGGAALNDDLSRAGFTTIALTPSRDAEPLADVIASIDDTDRVALLLGAEGPGLEQPTLASATRQARIALADGVDSLNVATAGAIALHSLTSAHPARLSPRPTSARLSRRI